jgi:AP-2 complex subunit mu-1
LRKRHGAGIAIDDSTFHRCVNLGSFDHDRTISFVPPDGEFALMKYKHFLNNTKPNSVLTIEGVLHVPASCVNHIIAQGQSHTACACRYRITQNVNLPFRVIPVVTEHGSSRVEFEIKVEQ